MKKTYFNPDHVRFVNQFTGHLSRFSSRRFPGADRSGSVAYKSDGGGTDPDAAREELLRKVTERLNTTLEERGLSKEQITAMKPVIDGFGKLNIEALREMADPEKGVIAMVTRQGEIIAELKEQFEKPKDELSVRAQVAAWMDTNKDAIAAIKTGHKKELTPLEIRAAAANPMLPSTVMPNGSTFITRMEIEKPVNAPFEPAPSLWEIIPKGTTGAETYIWVNRLPRDGAAAFIAPGVYKPNVSFTIDTDSSHAKKVAASEKMATELLQDIDGFVDWVESELKLAVIAEANVKVRTGVLSNTVPAGIQTLSVAFTNPGVYTTNPNYWDAMKAIATMLKAQPRFANREVVLLVNTVDKANADMVKAQEQGQLFIPATIPARIIEDPYMALGYIQAIVLDAYKVKIYKAFSMAWGWENDDFTKNLVTVIGEMRIHQYVKDSDAGFAVYDTYDNIIAAITKAP